MTTRFSLLLLALFASCFGACFTNALLSPATSDIQQELRQISQRRHKSWSTVKGNPENDDDDDLTDDVYAPYKCATCTTIIGLADQWKIVQNKPSNIQTLYDFCSMLPILFRLPCEYAVRSMGAQISDLLLKNETADYICAAIGVCDVSTNGMPKCNVFPLPGGSKSAYVRRLKQDRKKLAHHTSSFLEQELIALAGNGSTANWFRRQFGAVTFDPCAMPGISALCKYIETIFTLRRPIFDKDRDSFGFEPTLRGYAWRGRDCSDISGSTYPGRTASSYDWLFDSNCNGIKGMNWQSGLPWEVELCGKTDARGIAVMGDSVSAHFHIPEAYFNATLISAEILTNLTFVVENEADWPHLSYITGFQQNDWPIVQGATDSVYLRLRERNLCNHRDYQNLAENGADTFDAAIMEQSLSRDPKNDKPIILFYAFVGNDVCNHYADTLDHDTHAEQMRQNLQASFDYLGGRLPNGSYVVVTDIADARFLYDSMHDRIHPIGTVRNDVTYTDLYDYLNCMDVSPCRGWLTSNTTLRDLTYERTLVLNQVIQETVENNTNSYGNYKLYYLPNPIEDVFKAWNATGGQIWQLVEPSDGFHPNQFAHSLIGGVIWDKLLALDEDIVGPVNPQNDRIVEIFGNQGGH